MKLVSICGRTCAHTSMPPATQSKIALLVDKSSGLRVWSNNWWYYMISAWYTETITGLGFWRIFLLVVIVCSPSHNSGIHFLCNLRYIFSLTCLSRVIALLSIVSLPYQLQYFLREKLLLQMATRS